MGGRTEEQRQADWAEAMKAWHKACDIIDDAYRQGCSEEHIARARERDAARGWRAHS